MAISFMTISYMAIDYMDINYMVLVIGNWQWVLAIGYGYMVMVIDYIDRVKFGLLRFGVRVYMGLNVWFLGFRVGLFQVWSILGFWIFGA
jgi:hypothetical protein